MPNKEDYIFLASLGYRARHSFKENEKENSTSAQIW
jgi:hypothetical protein